MGGIRELAQHGRGDRDPVDAFEHRGNLRHLVAELAWCVRPEPLPELPQEFLLTGGILLRPSFTESSEPAHVASFQPRAEPPHMLEGGVTGVSVTLPIAYAMSGASRRRHAACGFGSARQGHSCQSESRGGMCA
ncbi:hypothetical protein Asi03nite_59710 [Actinoplanes siamensis]|uniref:Uncharacterized protein n=1 Tax=Actinoplanes siamensis TaxID=1223317 RepID=A0A919NCJ5_9ACTN|nr:hypothetical protein Asi03nite_59710 [Actinoplanes siamensis]